LWSRYLRNEYVVFDYNHSVHRGDCCGGDAAILGYVVMHDCPICGYPCYCDGEDHEQPAPDDCQHDCDEDEPEEF